MSTQSALMSHLMAPAELMCEPRLKPAPAPRVDPEDGIDNDADIALTSRKLGHKVDTWAAVWRVIFPEDPDSEIPSHGKEASHQRRSLLVDLTDFTQTSCPSSNSRRFPSNSGSLSKLSTSGMTLKLPSRGTLSRRSSESAVATELAVRRWNLGVSTDRPPTHDYAWETIGIQKPKNIFWIQKQAVVGKRGCDALPAFPRCRECCHPASATSPTRPHETPPGSRAHFLPYSRSL